MVRLDHTNSNTHSKCLAQSQLHESLQLLSLLWSLSPRGRHWHRSWTVQTLACVQSFQRLLTWSKQAWIFNDTCCLLSASYVPAPWEVWKISILNICFYFLKSRLWKNLVAMAELFIWYEGPLFFSISDFFFVMILIWVLSYVWELSFRDNSYIRQSYEHPFTLPLPRPPKK